MREENTRRVSDTTKCFTSTILIGLIFLLIHVVVKAHMMYKMVNENKLSQPQAWVEHGNGLPFTSTSFQKLGKNQLLEITKRLCDLVNAENMRKYHNGQEWEHVEGQGGELIKTF